MRRYAPRLVAALLTFSLGVLLTSVLGELRFRESLWNLYRLSISINGESGPRKCSEKWENASASGQPLGWDLTYFSTMTGLNLCPALCAEWGKPAPPIQKHVSEWQGDPIISSFEIEFPDGHAGMAAYWFIRTKDHAYYWAFYPLDTDYTGGKQVIPAQDYDNAFETISCWVQVEPRLQKFGSEGYVGFLSMYEEGKSRQMLLTYEDFIEGGKYTNENDLRPGPFSRALEPLVAPLRNRTRQ